jgi:tetratricopeptide (TPR) repeat protein
MMIGTLLLMTTLATVGVADLTWTDIVARLEKGAAASDANVLRPAIADAEKLADVTGQDRERELALLGAAYGAWRLSTVPDVQPAEAVTLLKGADKNLRSLLKMNAKSGEALALLASVIGQEIRYGGNKMELGPEASEVRANAVKAEPGNPRVVLQSAITLFHTPADYGGGPDKAEAGLRQAIALFEREPAARPWPNWGRFDAHAWLGQVLAARGDKAGARAEYNLALAAWPQSGWVKYVLMPALDK